MVVGEVAYTLCSDSLSLTPRAGEEATELAVNRIGVVDVCADELNLGRRGFEGVEPVATRRPARHPASLLKIYICGYLKRDPGQPATREGSPT
jgi:hypothetical protein